MLENCRQKNVLKSKGDTCGKDCIDWVTTYHWQLIWYYFSISSFCLWWVFRNLGLNIAELWWTPKKKENMKKGTNPSAESDFLSSSLRAFRTRTSLAFLATGSSYGLNLLFGAAHTAHTQPQNKDVQLSRKANQWLGSKDAAQFTKSKNQTLKCLSVWKLFTSKSFQGKNLLIKNKTAADYWFCVWWSLRA